MSEDVAGRLRSLAKEYSQGRLSLEVYRQVRAPLLDSLAARPQAAVSQTPAPSAELRTPRAGRSSVGWIGLLILAVLVIGALSRGLFRDRSRNEPDRVRAMSDSRRATATSSDRIFRLVAPLLDDPDWTEARIAAVNAALLEEGSRRIAAEHGTDWFQRFEQEVQRRLEEEQSALGADRAVPERSSLAALAATIGLNAPHEPPRPPARGT